MPEPTDGTLNEPIPEANPSGHEAPPNTRRFNWKKTTIPTLAVTAIAIAVTYYVAYRNAHSLRDSNGAIKNPANLTVNELRTGDCFNTPQSQRAASVDAVPCATPHSGQVIAIIPVPGADYPTSDQSDAEMAACKADGAAALAPALTTSTTAVILMHPDAASWQLGYHDLLCFVYDSSTARTVGSLLR